MDDFFLFFNFFTNALSAHRDFTGKKGQSRDFCLCRREKSALCAITINLVFLFEMFVEKETIVE